MIFQADRLSEIMGDKRPRDETKAVMVLLSSFPRQAGNEGMTDILYEAYSVACEEVPSWAVEEAVHRWVSGKCGAQHWAPSPPELRVAAETVIKIAKGKAAALRRLAAVRIEHQPTQQDKDRVIAQMNKLLTHVDVGDKRKPFTTSEKAA